MSDYRRPLFPPPDPERFTSDPKYARMRVTQAQAWVDGDTAGYAPQDPRSIMVELLAFVRAVAEADPGSTWSLAISRRT